MYNEWGAKLEKFTKCSFGVGTSSLQEFTWGSPQTPNSNCCLHLTGPLLVAFYDPVNHCLKQNLCRLNLNTRFFHNNHILFHQHRCFYSLPAETHAWSCNKKASGSVKCSLCFRILNFLFRQQGYFSLVELFLPLLKNEWNCNTLQYTQIFTTGAHLVYMLHGGYFGNITQHSRFK